MSYGLDGSGFNAKPATQVKSELDAAFKAGPLGASAGSEPDGSIPVRSLAGQFISILTDAFAGVWDVLLALWSNSDPATATGAALDVICALTGTRRKPATLSTVVAVACGDPGTVLPTGRVATVAFSGTRFASTAPKTIGGPLPQWANATGYLVGDRVFNPTDSDGPRVYQCIFPGTSAALGDGPTNGGDSGTDITDGSVHWTFLGSGFGAVDVPFAAEATGPFAALARTLTSIATPVSGWRSIRNITDAVVGSDVETDAELRVRRVVELVTTAAATVDAIRNRLLKVPGVKSCTVFHNDTDATDGDGLPPHSVEVLVDGGADADVWMATWLAVGGGIAMYGNTPGTIVDSQGTTQSVTFSRPTLVPIYVTIDVDVDALAYPSDGDTEIKVAVVDFGAPFALGRNVTASGVGSAAFSIPGVLDTTSVFIGTAPAPGTSTTIPIALRERATFDTGRIVVASTPVTP